MKRIFLLESFRKRSFLLYALLCCSCIFLSVLLITSQFTGFKLLYVYSRYAFIIGALLALGIYLDGTASFRHNVDEVISTCRQPGYYQRRALSLPAVYFAALMVIFLIALLYASAANDGTGYFLTWFLPSFLCNLLLPILIMCTASHIAAKSRRTLGSAVILVLFLILTSPLLTNLTWATEPTLPIDKLVGALFHPFRIFYENGSWSANSLIGLQTDVSRVYVLLFWVFLLTGIILFLHANRKGIHFLSIGLALVGLLFLVLSYLPSASYRISDENWDGVTQDYYTYYDQATGIDYEAPDFSVTSYDLNLSFGRYMQVDGTLQLYSKTPQTSFIFTLYHGYTIDALSAVECNLAYEIDGDAVTITTESPVTELSLSICYHGSHSIFFSYSEGATLPGWFPWYPMAGNHQVFVNLKTYPSGYNAWNKIDVAQITLHLDGKFSVVSNLPETAENTISGTADSITLIGGAVVTRSDNQILDYLPLNLTETPEQWSDDIAEQWSDICKSLESYALELPCSSDSKIIVAPADLCRLYSGLNGLAVFDDYVLTADGQLTIENMSKYMFLSHNPDSYLTSTVCSLGGLSATPEETLNNWQIYLMGTSDNEIEQALQQALKAADSSGKGTEAVIEIANFLCTDGAEGNELTFLKGLCEQYGAD